MVDRHPRAAIRTQRSHEFAPQTRGNTNPTLCPNGRTRDGLRGAQQGRDCSVQTRSAREVGVRFGTVLSDGCSGSSAAFRHAPGKRGLSWVVGILRRRKVDAVDLTLVPPPDRVRKLVLIDADGYQPSVLSMPIAFQIASMRGLRWVSERILPKAMVASSVRNVFGDPDKVTQDKIDRYFELNLRVGNRRALFQRMDQAQFGGNSTLIRRVQQPTLVIWGERDEMISPEHGTLFCQDIQRCRLVTYPTLGHLPQEEDPEGTLPDLVSFLAN